MENIQHDNAALLEKGWSNKDVLAVDAVIDEFKGQEGVRKIWAYGSMANGKADKKPDKRSDIDIAIEIDDLPENKWKEIKKVDKTGSTRDIHIQIFRTGFEEEQVYSKKSGSLYDEFRKWALQRLKDQIMLWQK